MVHIQINQPLPHIGDTDHTDHRNGKTNAAENNSTLNIIRYNDAVISVNYVSDDEINRQVSQIIYGRIDSAFKPCHSEKDAWKVVGWMQTQHIWENGQLLSPRAICHSLLAQISELEAV